MKKENEQSKNQIRERVWKELRNFAKPDSRFHWDFSSFIPDFDDSQICCNNIRISREYIDSETIFITPDNCLDLIRRFAIEDKKKIIISSYGLERDFFYIKPGSIPLCESKLASTLDGLELFGKNIKLSEVKAFEKIDLLVTGASMITNNGLRWGKGHGYFDLEWAMFREIGVCFEETPIFAVIHDCQLVNINPELSKYDTLVDVIFTPKQTIKIHNELPKPLKVYWELLTEDQLLKIPALKELREKFG